MACSGGAGWNHAVSFDGTYDGVVSGKIEELSVGTDGTFHILCVCELNQAMISSRGAGWNHEVSSLADTGKINRQQRMIPTIRPIRALVLIFNCKTSIIFGKVRI
jgi:hypothetical protein